MKLKNLCLITCLLILICPLLVFAQLFPAKNYPQGYFGDPLDLPISLSGNFGELRPNHFHMGLDLKTQATVNHPVYAAADGYVARIKIEPYGFGQAVYINHPNGFTTLYAHLNAFFPSLEQYVKKQQYRQEAWNVFLSLPPGMFPVKKGDLIAYSGSTGGSQGPHVHFEVRRTADDVNLNPMLFGLPLADNTKPVLRRLAMYDRTISTYEQTPKLISVTKTANGYVTAPGVVKTPAGKISFAISAYDTHSGSTNQNGIYEALFYDNNQLVSGFQIDNVSYNDTRYINAHIDYKTKATGGGYLQHLSMLPGNLHSVYKKGTSDGVISITDGLVHAIRIVVKDAYGNSSEVNLSVQYNGTPVVRAPMPGKMFYPMVVNFDETDDCEYFIGENCLYDSVHIRYARTLPSAGGISATHVIGYGYIPLQDSIVVRIKPLASLAPEKMNRVLMQRVYGPSTDVKKVRWQHGWATAMFRNLGNFRLIIDEEPPTITPIGFANGANLSRATSIAFAVKDNNDEFMNFRAELDGKWLRFTNDKGRTFIYRFDEMCSRGDHELTVHVEDEAGNLTTRLFKFTR